MGDLDAAEDVAEKEAKEGPTQPKPQAEGADVKQGDDK